MADHGFILQGLAYVPGVAFGELQCDTAHPGGIALVGQKEALNPVQPQSGLIIVDGAPLSHAMIGLLAQGIPTVIIDSAQASLIKKGAEVRVDGATGLITIGGGEISSLTNTPPAPEAGTSVLLADGTAVWLMASVRNADQARQAVISGAGGIGLVRSEFLGWDRLQPPDTSYFMDELEKLCISAGGLAVTIRLVDIAADKPPHWLPQAKNILDSLGMQGTRLYHKAPVRSVVQSQLTALAELSKRFSFEVLIPNISSHDELLYWREIVRQSLPQNVPVGAMAETPASVMDIANWDAEVDFLAIGCNDLMQCFFGADRDVPELQHLIDPYAPVLYRLLKQVADSAVQFQDRLRLCGVLPRLVGVLPVLVGLGFRRFSVDPAWVPYMAEELPAYNAADAEGLAQRVCACTDSKEVRDLLGLTGKHVCLDDE